MTQLVDIESEKANVAIEAECDGVITKIISKRRRSYFNGQVIGEMEGR